MGGISNKLQWFFSGVQHSFTDSAFTLCKHQQENTDNAAPSSHESPFCVGRLNFLSESHSPRFPQGQRGSGFARRNPQDKTAQEDFPSQPQAFFRNRARTLFLPLCDFFLANADYLLFLSVFSPHDMNLSPPLRDDRGGGVFFVFPSLVPFSITSASPPKFPQFVGAFTILPPISSSLLPGHRLKRGNPFFRDVISHHGGCSLRGSLAHFCTPKP